MNCPCRDLLAAAPTATTGGGGGGITNPTLSVKTSGGKGLITSNVGGINCGKTC